MTPIAALFERRVRGWRLVNLVGAGALLLVAFAVVLVKAGATEERNRIVRLEKTIALEHKRLRLLRAEVAYLEQPSRVEALSRAHLGLQPVPARHETSPDALIEIARAGAGR